MTIDLEKLLQVPYVDPENGYDIEEGGKRAAFSWNPHGQWEIFETDLPLEDLESIQKPANPPRQVSSGPGTKMAPLYSPDGKRLVYGVDYDGSENLHIFVLDLATCQQKNITPDSRAAILPYFVWSPDSKEIAFISDANGHFCTYALPSEGGLPRLILDVKEPARTLHWSPNGKWLTVSVEASGQDYRSYVVPAGGGRGVMIREPGGPLSIRHSCWSAEGNQVVFSATRGEWNDIGIYEVEGESITWLTSGEGNKIYPDLSPNGENLAYILSRGTETSLVVKNLRGDSEPFQVDQGVHYAPIFTPDSQSILLTFDNPRYPTDLWLFSLKNHHFQQITHSLPSGLLHNEIPMPKEITYPGMDGIPIPALLFHPTSPDPCPAVVLIHGGPTWLFQKIWYPLIIHMVSRGWIVLTPGYRGSTGYGHSWQTANRFDLGGIDTQDCAAGATYLLQQGLAVEKKIAVTGRSHGGYLTMTCLTQYPNLWAGGSAVVPFMNWFTSHKYMREDLRHWDIENMGDPGENYTRWHDHSPYFYLDRVSGPVQLICAENDPRCPIEDTLETKNKLEELGKELDFHLYPEEGHSFLKKKNLIDAEKKRIDFLAGLLEK